MGRRYLFAAIVPALALASCSGGNAPTGSTSAPASETPSQTAATQQPGLDAYVGKYPFDEVNGTSWETNAAVINGVKATVTDPAVAARVLDYSGPASPIAMVNGMVVASSCETHDCGAHNWEILVDAASGATQVCYHDEAKTPGKSIWYLPGGKHEKRAGPCSIS